MTPSRGSDRDVLLRCFAGHEWTKRLPVTQSGFGYEVCPAANDESCPTCTAGVNIWREPGDPIDDQQGVLRSEQAYRDYRAMNRGGGS